MNSRDLIVPVLLMIGLSGCQTNPGQNPLDNPLYQIPAQSTLQLNQALEFPVGSSRSFIQFGQVVGADSVDIRDHSCHFYRREHPDDLLRVRALLPDRFTITKTVQTEDFASSTGVFFSMGFKLGLMNVSADIDGNPDVDLTTILYLESQNNPEVVQLRCGIFTEPSLSNHLSINDIKKVLGNIATLDINR